MLGGQEYGYFLDRKAVAEFLDYILKRAVEQEFKTGCNNTLYINNPEYEVPFHVSLRARNYSERPMIIGQELDPRLKWNFERQKEVSLDSRLKNKKNTNLTLGEILNMLSTPQNLDFYATEPLSAYAATSYSRRHFLIDRGIRVTLDENAKYFGVNQKRKLEGLGKDSESRIELKFDLRKADVNEVKKMGVVLGELGATRLLSKRDTAYNLIAKDLRRKHHEEEDTDTEIEAKLAMERDDERVFHMFKSDINNGLVGDFRLLRDFPLTIETGKLLSYIDTPAGEYVRLNRSGHATYKDRASVLEDPFGLNCILKRREIKRNFDHSLLNGPLRTIHKKRKYFFAENLENGEEYCISVDRTTYFSNQLYQLEIESVLSSPTHSEVKRAMLDIAEMTRAAIRRYPSLRPTTMSKLEWLEGLKTPKKAILE